ncbi:hypothetical protein BH10PSE12_BH10PSE12_23100 [soil metagenome]
MELKSEFLCDMAVDVLPGFQVGQAPFGTRVIAPFAGGRFSGPRFRGVVLPAGGDWFLIRGDGVMEIDVRAILQTDDGHVLNAIYGGRMVIPTALMEQAFDPERVEHVDPADYYFRTTPVFEAASDSPYGWLNGKVAAGVGRLTRSGVAYKIYLIE